MTGVKTCALPISRRSPGPSAPNRSSRSRSTRLGSAWRAVAALWLCLLLIAAPSPRAAADAATGAAAPNSPASAAPPSGGDVPAAVRYAAPTSAGAPILRGFDDVGRYAAGHRGVDLDVAAAPDARSAADGEVEFAGQVAGRGVVVIAHADGIRTTYEPLAPSVAAGQRVARGDPIGAIAGAHGGFPAGATLHWGARLGDAYLDPLTLLRPLGVVRLVP